MKHFLRIAFLFIGLVCFVGQVAHAQNLQKEIIGRWSLSKIDLKSTEYDKMNDEQKQQFESFKSMMMMGFEEIKEKAFFDFKKDGTMTTYNEEKGEASGTWKIEGNKLKMKEDGKEEEEANIKIEKGILTIVINNPDMPTMMMVMDMIKK